MIMEMIINFLSSFEQVLSSFFQVVGPWSVLFSSLLLVCESIMPILPSSVFIAINFIYFGKLVGFVISWICACLGCYISFSLCRSKIKGFLEKKILKEKGKKKMERLVNIIDNIDVSLLTLLIACPFTPACIINILCGLSNMSKKKFMLSILIGKVFMVYFFGYVGTTLMDCITHPIYMVRVIILLVAAFIISKISFKITNIE